MKTLCFAMCFLVAAASCLAQSKDEKTLIDRTYLLSHTVFGTKDSAVLDDLFARKATYGHSHGNLQTREQAINGISKNRSTYSDTAVSNVQVLVEDDAAIVRHLFRAKENKADGSTTPLNFSMMLVWVKEKGKWRLMGRQAVSLSDK
ncbi:nuclear transport factor 2 family protein [Flavisolibacter nicotianae]|uniref:nuclear transport factor 2 family protein n=1 Tax=Flavisolibacter nicotianae TaxID=2364882 RepID=UPI000EAC74C8|nr:nuclear transport factor 2 family protein [Flavisolibacter nicotianae]